MTDLEPHTRSRQESGRASSRARSVADVRPDAMLLQAATSGDDGAFGEFYLRHANRLYRYFRSRSGSPQDAYDLVSETFAQALASIGEFNPDRGEPGGWLFGIAKNKHRRYARRGAVETRGRLRMELAIVVLSPGDIDRLEELIDLDDVRQRLQPAILSLPTTLGEAVRLRCLEGEDYDDIASQLGIRPATARKRVSRGLRQLGELLGNSPFDIHD